MSTPLTWPLRCDMPDLSGLFAGTSVNSALNRMFAGRGPKDPLSHALQVNFNRVVDGMIQEYAAARENLTIAATPGGDARLTELIMAIGHFENCINCGLRAIRFAQRLRNRSRGVIVPLKLSVLTSGVEDHIREMRNAIEHLDKDLACGTWDMDHAYCLLPKEDRIELGGQTILFSDLAQWVRDLHALAMDTAQFQEP